MIMNLKKLAILFLVLIMSISGCTKENKNNEPDEALDESKPTMTSSSSDFEILSTTIATKSLTDSPLDATFKFGDLEPLGLSYLSAELDELSIESFNEDIAYTYEMLDRLKGFNYDDLSYEQQLTLEMLSFQYELMDQSKDYYYYDNLIQPTSGIHINMPLALMQIELNSVDDVDAYMERVMKLPLLFEQVILYEEKKASLGLLLPEDLYDDVIEQIDGLLVEPEDFLMVQSFNSKIDALDITSEAKEDYKAEFLSIITSVVYPSYESLSNSISLYKTNSPGDSGLSSWINGKDYYNLIIKEKTSYDMDGADLKEWATTQKANTLDSIIKLYENNASLMEITSLNDVFPTFNNLEEIYNIEGQCLNDLFYDYGISPAAEEIIPSYLEDHLAAGFYFPVSLDNNSYGTMFLREDTYNHIDYSTLNLYFHENIPGHHLYFSYLANSNLPLIRKLIGWLPYEEGWAIYVEKYAYNYIGIDEPITELLKLNDAYFNYTVMLLDIRYHYEGESRESLVSELVDEGYPPRSAEAIINRIIANPGEVIHYYYGGYKFEGYLEAAKSELADSFNIKEFHDLLLRNAGLPFSTMDRVVDEWIESKK